MGPYFSFIQNNVFQNSYWSFSLPLEHVEAKNKYHRRERRRKLKHGWKLWTHTPESENMWYVFQRSSPPPIHHNLWKRKKKKKKKTFRRISFWKREGKFLLFLLLLFFFFLVFCLFFRAISTAYGGSQARGISGVVVASVLLLVYARATETPDPSYVCNPYHSSQQRQILNPLGEARDQTHNLMVPNWIAFCCVMMGTPLFLFCFVRKTMFLLIPLKVQY